MHFYGHTKTTELRSTIQYVLPAVFLPAPHQATTTLVLVSDANREINVHTYA